MNHPQPATLETSIIRTVPMTQEIKEFIQTQISMDNLNSIGLYENVVTRFEFVVNRGQVLTAWREAFIRRYKMDEDQLDQLLSSRLLVRSLQGQSGCEER
ncbi:unnamed protein product [Absidia cylindrospora]